MTAGTHRAGFELHGLAAGAAAAAIKFAACHHGAKFILPGTPGSAEHLVRVGQPEHHGHTGSPAEGLLILPVKGRSLERFDQTSDRGGTEEFHVENLKAEADTIINKVGPA